MSDWIGLDDRIEIIPLITVTYLWGTEAWKTISDHRAGTARHWKHDGKRWRQRKNGPPHMQTPQKP